MGSRRPVAWALAALGLAAGLVAGTARAEGPCALPAGTYYAGAPGSGFGGTGHSNEGGLGGTGHGEEGGLGGTGHQEEGGLGGTGILGTVTGFGSLCVNGLRVGYDAGAIVILRGETGSTEDLERAQVVWLRASLRDGALWTDRIEIVSAAVGLIEELDSDGKRMTVDGQGIEIPDAAQIVAENGEALELATLTTGDFVDVAALPTADGRWIATRVVRLPEGASGYARLAEIGAELTRRTDLERLSVEGFAAAAAKPSDLRVSGVLVSVPSEIRNLTRAARDARVVVEGRLEAGALRLERLAIRPERLERPRSEGPAPRDDPRNSMPGPRPSTRPDTPDTPDLEPAPPRPERSDRPERPSRPERPAVDRPERIDRPAADVVAPRSSF